MTHSKPTTNSRPPRASRSTADREGKTEQGATEQGATDLSQGLPNVDAAGRAIPGVTREGAKIESAPEDGSEAPRTVGDAGVTVPEVEAVVGDGGKKVTVSRTASLSLDAALAYLRSRRGENSPSSAESSRDSAARATREKEAIRVRWHRGEASRFARDHGTRQADEAKIAVAGSIRRLEQQREREIAAMAQVRALHERGEKSDDALSAAERSHVSALSGLDGRIADERRRLEARPETPDAREVQGGEHLLPREGPVTLKII